MESKADRIIPVENALLLCRPSDPYNFFSALISLDKANQQSEYQIHFVMAPALKCQR